MCYMLPNLVPGKGRRKSDGCPMFALAYMGQKKMAAA